MTLGRGFSWVGVPTVIALLLSNSIASAQPSLIVAWRDGRLSVVAQDVALADVLREIAKQTGVEVVGLDRIRRTQSIEFAGKRLAEGLKLVLEELDYVMAIRDPVVLTTNRPPMRIWLHPEPLPVEGSVAPVDADLAPLPEPAFGRDDGGGPEVESPVPASTDPEIPEALASAADVDPELRALEESRFFDEASETSVLQATTAESPAVRARALEVLGTRDSSVSADALGNGMIDSDPAVSSRASALMADSHAPNVIENLGRMLSHSDPVVRFTALELLARRGDPESLAYLKEVVDDENDVVRTAAQRLAQQLAIGDGQHQDR
jgi:hypothetical protein